MDAPLSKKNVIAVAAGRWACLSSIRHQSLSNIVYDLVCYFSHEVIQCSWLNLQPCMSCEESSNISVMTVKEGL